MRAARNIDVLEACERINRAGIASLVNHPACAEVFLNDGARITIWDGSYEHARVWEIEEAQS